MAVKNSIDLDAMKNFMEQRTDGIEIIEHSSSNRIIAKVDTNLNYKYYNMTIASSFIDYCGKVTNQ